jgi:MFS family permease
MDSLQAGGADEATAGAITATAMGVFYALANGIGRIVWGMISDKTGRKTAIFLMCLLQGLAMLSFWFIGKSMAMFYIWSTIIGFNFGGNFALYPAATADYFGNKNIGTNYGWMFTAYGVGGIIGPVLAGMFKDKVPAEAEFIVKYSAWMAPFMIAGIASIIASIVILVTQKPKAAA